MFECSLPSICQIFTTLIVFFVAKFAYEFYTSNKKKVPPKLHKTDWKENVVYLYQFERSKYVPNISPFCLKLETYLRVNNIKYEVIGTNFFRSNKGLLPFIELNGQHIADSQLIILTLQKHFNIDVKDLKENITDEQQAIGRAIDRMLDGSFFIATYVFKVREHVLEMSEVVVESWPANFLKYLLAPILYYKANQRLNAEGTGRHSLEEVMTIMRSDLAAVDQILGDKEYIVGNVPSLADCTLFGHLAAGYYLPYDYPLKHMLDEEFPRLKKHMFRMASSFYKDHAIGAKSGGDSAAM